MTDATPAEPATGDALDTALDAIEALPPQRTAGVWDALVAFQADLPDVAAAQEARVVKDGSLAYTYKYADLADVSRVVLRRMGKLGCAWVTIPRSTDRGVVLSYHLRHAAAGDEITGEWFIGTGDPQQLGSRITYARRYALLAVTGVFPAGEDDDGARGAAARPEQRERPAQQRRERPAQAEQPAGRQQTARPVQASSPTTAPVEDQGVPGPQTRAVEQQALRDSVQRAQAKADSVRASVPAVDQKASVGSFLAGDPLFPTAQLAAAAKLFGDVQQEGTTGWRSNGGAGPSLLDVWESRLVRALAACTSADGARRIEAMIEQAGMRGSHPKLTEALIEAYERHGVDPLGAMGTSAE